MPTNELGEEDDGGELIGIRVTQKKYKVDEASVRDTIRKVSHYLGVGDFQVDVWYCSEDKIRELNDDWRGKRKSTDVLSFPANEFTSPMVFDESDPTLRHMKHLGDIIVAPAYVHRQIERDRRVYAEEGEYVFCYRIVLSSFLLSLFVYDVSVSLSRSIIVPICIL
jgi:rRNA maturation RNase YbeY